ncbi:MAG: aminotransferase class III-fold pyridoxal phosphate-dependent enzyme [Bdellovibrionota bacterium]
MNSHFYYVFGANTDIGKTVFSAGLSRVFTQNSFKTKYIKPIQTGYPTHCDATFVSTYAKSTLLEVKTFYTSPEAISPHRCVPTATDDELMEQIKNEVKSTVADFILIEGAGGIASPTLNGQLQCDFYREILRPVIFIADSKLGGISTTITSIELAQSRGMEIACILLFEGENENALFLKNHFKEKIPVVSFSNINTNLTEWYKQEQKNFSLTFLLLQDFQNNKTLQVKNSLLVAKEHVWWPFTQHQNINEAKYIDSAFKEEISFSDQNDYDGCASWFTQSIGHANINLTKAASFASGRYGHVMFPGNIHEPAAKLTQKLIETVGKDWAKRVFFSDNGSTANEIAIKMALRKSFGQEKNISNPIILGLKDSYHGDTHATMDATNPNTFKIADHWYNPRGYWLNYPKIYMKNKKYIVLTQSGEIETNFENKSQIFSFLDRQNSELYSYYTNYIEEQFHFIETNKLNVGACLLEGVVMAAGGMQFIDPLFQKILVEQCQKRKIPVILDEVFTGFWRLGKISAAQMLNIKPDIACYGKILTGGLIPMAVTLAKEEIFNEFLHDSLAYALLHGHSYTATPVGCNVSLAAMEEITKSLYFNHTKNELNEIWSEEIVEKISVLPNVERVFNLGSLLALELKDENSDYASVKSKNIIIALKANHIYARPLGNVIYILAGYNTKLTTVKQMEDALYQSLTRDF